MSVHARAGRIPRRFPAWTALLLPLAVLLAYAPGLGGGFVFDDYPNIVDNAALRVTSDWRTWIGAALSEPGSASLRPLAMISFAANVHATGLDPWPMKLANVLVHAGNALLVFGLLRALLRLRAAPSPRDAWVAAGVAAAWALHPINLTAVLFVVQRMESLAHVFVFAGLWLYLSGRARQRQGANGWPRIALGMVGGSALGALSKESAVLLPLYAACVELCLLRFAGARPARTLPAFFLVVLVLPAAAAAAWVLPKVLAPGAWAHRDYGLLERLLTEPRVLWDYLQWTVLPSLRELSLYHDDYVVSRGLLSPPSTLAAIAGLAALAIAAAWLRTRRPLASLGIAWFLAAHVLTGTVIQLELVYEHRNYFASLGICLAMADLLLLAPRGSAGRRLGALVAGALLLAFALTTHLRAREWGEPLRFVASEAAKQPGSPRAAYDHARLLVVLSGYDHDSPWLPRAREALARARATPGSGILAHSASLILAARTGGDADPAWWRGMQQRLREEPVGPQQTGALSALSVCARDGHCAFPPREMVATFLAALARGPQADVLTVYGDYAWNVLRDRDLALRAWREAHALQPGTPEYHANLVRALIAVGDFRAARSEIDALERRGRFGRNRALARTLEARLERAAFAHPDRERPGAM